MLCQSLLYSKVNQLYLCLYPLLQMLFLHMSLQSIEQSFLCCTVGHYCLSILYTVVCICQSQASNLSLPDLPPDHYKFVFYTCIQVFQIFNSARLSSDFWGQVPSSFLGSVYYVSNNCGFPNLDFPDSSVGKEANCSAGEPWFDSWVRKNSLEKGQATHSSILGFPLWLSW